MGPIPNPPVPFETVSYDDQASYLWCPSNSQHREQRNIDSEPNLVDEADPVILAIDAVRPTGLVLPPQTIESLDQLGIFHEVSSTGWALKNQAFFTHDGTICENRPRSTTAQDYPLLCVHRSNLDKIIRSNAHMRGASSNSNKLWNQPKSFYNKGLNLDYPNELVGNIEAELRQSAKAETFVRYHGTAMFEKVLDGHTIVHAGNHQAMLSCFPLEKPELSRLENGSLVQRQLIAFMVDVDEGKPLILPGNVRPDDQSRKLDQITDGFFLPFLEHKKLFAAAKIVECSIVTENEFQALRHQSGESNGSDSADTMRVLRLDDSSSQFVTEARFDLRRMLDSRREAQKKSLNIVQHSATSNSQVALVMKIPSAMRLLIALSPIERVLATANGNMQRLLSSICLAEVFVKPVHTTSRGDHFLDRMVELLIHSEQGPVVATCITTVVLHCQELREDLISQKMGIGQILTQLSKKGLVATFNLLSAGKKRPYGNKSGLLTRQYDLTIRNHVSFLIHEQIDLDVLFGK